MKLALCNEVIRELSFAAQCKFASQLGYEGIEIAPFTLFDEAHQFNSAHAQLSRQQASDAGLSISSLHWLLVKPDGLSLVSQDQTVRQKTQDWLGLVHWFMGRPSKDPLKAIKPSKIALAVFKKCWRLLSLLQSRRASRIAWSPCHLLRPQ